MATLTVTATPTEAGLYNRLAKRYMEIADDGTCILFTYNRPSDEEYKFVRSNVPRDEADAWFNGGDEAVHALRVRQDHTDVPVIAELNSRERAKLADIMSRQPRSILARKMLDAIAAADTNSRR